MEHSANCKYPDGAADCPRCIADYIAEVGRTTHLYRGNSQGEILDADGKVVGIIIKPGAMEWLNGEGSFECPPERYFRGEPPRYWWRSVFREKAGRDAAAPTDWSAVAVRVPETTGFDGPFAAGMQHALDAILGAK